MLILNGGQNPPAVTYNGTALDKVVCNGTTVWDKSIAQKRSTPDIPRLDVQGRNYAASFSGGSFLGWMTSSGSLVPRYQFSSSTFWLYTEQRAAAVKRPSSSSGIWGYLYLNSRSITWGAEGLPSNLYVEDIPTIGTASSGTGELDLPFYVRKSDRDDTAISDLPVETRRCRVNFYRLGETDRDAPYNANVTIYSTGGEAALYTTGITYEVGTGNIRLTMGWKG